MGALAQKSVHLHLHSQHGTNNNSLQPTMAIKGSGRRSRSGGGQGGHGAPQHYQQNYGGGQYGNQSYGGGQYGNQGYGGANYAPPRPAYNYQPPYRPPQYAQAVPMPGMAGAGPSWRAPAPAVRAPPPRPDARPKPAYQYMQAVGPLNPLNPATFAEVAPDLPPGEPEAEKAHQTLVAAQEAEKAKKPAVLFYDPNTGTMSTKDPNAPEEDEKEEEPAGPWVELQTDKGKQYFYNTETKERAWEKPASEKVGEKDAEEEDDTGVKWHQFKTDDGFFFWNSDEDPPATTWGPPPKGIKETEDEKSRWDSLQWVWTKIEPPFKPEDTFGKDGEPYYYNPFSRQAQLSQPGKMVFKAVPAWEERVSKTDQPYYFDKRCRPR